MNILAVKCTGQVKERHEMAKWAECGTPSYTQTQTDTKFPHLPARVLHLVLGQLQRKAKKDTRSQRGKQTSDKKVIQTDRLLLTGQIDDTRTLPSKSSSSQLPAQEIGQLRRQGAKERQEGKLDHLVFG